MIIPALPGFNVVVPTLGDGNKATGFTYEPVIGWDVGGSFVHPITVEGPHRGRQIVARPDGSWVVPGMLELESQQEALDYVNKGA